MWRSLVKEIFQIIENWSNLIYHQIFLRFPRHWSKSSRDEFVACAMLTVPCAFENVFWWRRSMKSNCCCCCLLTNDEDRRVKSKHIEDELNVVETWFYWNSPNICWSKEMLMVQEDEYRIRKDRTVLLFSILSLKWIRPWAMRLWKSTHERFTSNSSFCQANGNQIDII